MKMLVCAAVAIALAASPGPSPSPTFSQPPGLKEVLRDQTSDSPAATRGLSAATIFAKARLAMYLRTYPRYVAYIIDVQANTNYGKHYHEGFRALLRTHDGALAVHSTPVYTSNQPPNPYGFSFFGINPEGKPRDHIDPPFGIPLMSATYDFDLARGPTPQHYGGAIPPEEQAPIIGRIEVSGADYDVALLGEDEIDGNPVYHLSLTPREDPEHNRVRELWVDERTFDVRRLVTDGIFEQGPPTTVRWTVNFIDLHGWWFIRTETTNATLRGPGHFLAAGTEYEGVTYTFGRYEYPGLISDLEFTDFNLSTNAVQE
jgi:hypothetical protein